MDVAVSTSDLHADCSWKTLAEMSPVARQANMGVWWPKKNRRIAWNHPWGTPKRPAGRLI